MDGGLGTLRYGSADAGLQLGRARLALTQSLGELWSVHLDASMFDDKDRSPRRPHGSLPVVPSLSAPRPALARESRRLLRADLAREPRRRLGVALHAVVLGHQQLAGPRGAHASASRERSTGSAHAAVMLSTSVSPAGCSAGTRAQAWCSPMTASRSPTARPRCSAVSASPEPRAARGRRAVPAVRSSRGHLRRARGALARSRGRCVCCAMTTALIPTRPMTVGRHTPGDALHQRRRAHRRRSRLDRHRAMAGR